MEVKILFFASFRDIVGSSSLQLAILESTTTTTVFEQLCQSYPQLKEGADQISVAVNKVYITAPVTLKDGDEVAFLPPISGG